MVATYKQYRRKNEVAKPSPPTATSHEGGAVHALDVWSRLRRFLVLGSAVGTYYVNADVLTKQNTDVIEDALRTDPSRALKIIAEVGNSFVAPKHDPVLYALAVAAGFDYGSMELNKFRRSQAYDAAVSVCRTWTHVSHFLTYRSEAGIAGRGQRRFVRRWFNEKSADKIAYQAIKYPSRDGWAQRDALILARPKPRTPAHDALYNYIVTGKIPELQTIADHGIREIMPVVSREILHSTPRPTPMEAASLIRLNRLPREAVPTELLNSREVWQALVDDMPYTALIRNLNKLTALGALQGSYLTRVLDMLSDEVLIRGSHIHPFSILTALKQYTKGHGDKGNLTWTPISEVSWALDGAFTTAFKNVQPTGKRILLSLDVSSSMTQAAGNTGMSCREVEAAMALVTLNVEERADVIGYTDKAYDLRTMIRPSMQIMEAVSVIARHPAGWTNCGVPMRWAAQADREYDAFVSYTDGETNDRPGNVPRILTEYRESFVADARHVVVAMAANRITLADPTDHLSLDIAGFGSDVPNVIGEFVAGRI